MIVLTTGVLQVKFIFAVCCHIMDNSFCGTIITLLLLLLHITILNYCYCISSYKSPGFYFLPSIPDPAFKQGRLLFKTRHLFSIERNDVQRLIKAKLKQP